MPKQEEGGRRARLSERKGSLARCSQTTDYTARGHKRSSQTKPLVFILNHATEPVGLPSPPDYGV